MGKINVAVDLADLDMPTQAALLGHTYDSTAKTLVKKTTDTAPYVALMFEFLMGNGKKRVTTLYKGKFAIPTQSGQTKGENVEFQTSQISASFVQLKGAGGNTARWEHDADYDADASTDAAYSAVPLANS